MLIPTKAKQEEEETSPLVKTSLSTFRRQTVTGTLKPSLGETPMRAADWKLGNQPRPLQSYCRRPDINNPEGNREAWYRSRRLPETTYQASTKISTTYRNQ